MYSGNNWNQQPIVGNDPEEDFNGTLWVVCVDPTVIVDTTQRVDSYLAFIQDACKDCGLPGAPPVGTQPPIDTEEGTTVDGEPMDFGGNESNF